jgi:protein-S-isoprenylcysteine O-methyltransferase Ste14
MRRSRAAAGSAVFFVLAPCTVAGAIPWTLTGWRSGWSAPGWVVVIGVAIGGSVLAAGTVVLVSTFARFVIEGAGTPAPVAPTAQLVVGGLYRYVRNPMYLAVLATILGQALILGRPVLVLYAGAVAVAVMTFVRLYEEPSLLREFGDSYVAYQAAVPGWWPRLSPWHPRDTAAS